MYFEDFTFTVRHDRIAHCSHYCVSLSYSSYLYLLYSQPSCSLQCPPQRPTVSATTSPPPSIYVSPTLSLKSQGSPATVGNLLYPPPMIHPSSAAECKEELELLEQCLSTSIELELMSTSRCSGRENNKDKLVVEVAVASGQYT